MFYFQMLGDVALYRDGPAGDCCIKNSRTLAILAWLAITPKHAVRRDYLATLMWPESGPRARRRSLRQALYYLKQQGVGRLLRIDDETVALRSELVETDVDLFEECISEGDFGAAIDLYGGPFLEGLRGSISGEIREWVDARGERLRVAFRVAATRGIEEALETDDGETAIAISARYVDSDPLDGRAQRLHVRSLVADGRKAEALMAYEEYATLLRSALEDRPEAELDALIAPVRGEIFGPLDTARTGIWDGTDEIGETEDAAPWPRYAVPALALLGAAVTLALTLPRVLESPPEIAGYLTVRSAGDTVWHEVAVRDRSLQPADAHGNGLRHTERSVPLPDRSGVAFWRATEDGYDVFFRPAGDADSIAVSATPDEEHTSDWSPDGRILLYDRGRLTSDATDVVHELWAWDRVENVHRLVLADWSGRNLVADWSPDGRRIAAYSQRRVEILRPDGSDRNTVHKGGTIWGLTWGPDGRRLAIAYEEGDRSVLQVVNVEGEDQRRLASTHGRFRESAWLEDSLLAVVHEPGPPDSAHLEFVNPATGHRETVSGGERIVEIDPEWTRSASRRWLQSVTASTPQAPLIGVRTPFRARALWSDGSVGDIPADELTWRVIGDAPHATFTSPGNLHLSATDSVRIEAGFPGWRTDTVVVAARPVVATALEPVFVEDWSDGMREELWQPLGTPEPVTRPAGDPENGGVFIGHGDATFHSGAITRRTFATDEGLTLEAWGRMPAMDRPYLDFGLVVAEPGDRGPGSGTSREVFDRPYLRFSMIGEFREAYLTAGTSDHSVEWPAPDGEWHLYSLQIAPDGAVLLLVDGEPVASLPQAMPDEFFGTPVAVGLYGRSAEHDDVDVQHGVVRAYEGVKYGVGEP